MKRECQRMASRGISIEARFVAVAILAMMKRGELEVGPEVRATIFPGQTYDRKRFRALCQEAEAAGVIEIVPDGGKYFFRRPGAKVTRKAKAVNTSPVVMTFPVAGSETEWALHLSDVEAWERLYPDLDVRQELRGALAHVMAGNRKTGRGMKTYLVAWLNRAVQFSKRGTGIGSHGAIKVPEAKSRGRLSGILDGLE